MKQVIFDVETIKTFDQVGGYHPEKLGISFVGAIIREGLPELGPVKETRLELFEDQLEELWPVFETADLIIGYNSIEFDLPALKPYYSGDLAALPSLDLFRIIKNQYGRRISLDAVAQQTLGTQKIGHGLDAIKYYRNQEFDKLKKYCMKDVEITRDVYDYGRQQKKVKFLNHWNNLVELPVDFSYSLPSQSATQMTLI